jgi:Tfp pilus assembly protein PilN
LLEEPGAGKSPGAVGGAPGDAQKIGCLLLGQAGEETQLDQFGSLGIVLREVGQGLIECEEIVRGQRFGELDLLDVNALPSATAFLSVLATRVFDEDTPHGLGGGGEEMLLTFPFPVWGVHQPQPGFVDQGSGLQSLSRGFVGKLVSRQSAQFVVQQRQQLLSGAGIITPFHRGHDARIQIESLALEQIKEIDRLRDQTQALLARKQIVETLQANRTEAVHLLDQLVRQLPDGVYLRSVKQNGTRVTLVGYAQSNARVSTLMRNIEASPWLTGPELIEIKSVALDRQKVNEFTLALHVKRAAPPADSKPAGPPAKAPAKAPGKSASAPGKGAPA